ncbi:MAG: hypothetical protein ACYS3S_26665, partial [Planctomycetota bacterium]
HCANQISCYGLAEAPGTAYAYNDWQMALFWDTLFQKVYGVGFKTVDAEVLHPMLTDKLQCQDNPTFMAFGTGDRAGRTAISTRDFARFGLLYLRKGKWKDEQLLSPEYATMAVTNPVPNSIRRAGDVAADMIPGQRSIGSRQIPDNQCEHASRNGRSARPGCNYKLERHEDSRARDGKSCAEAAGKFRHSNRIRKRRNYCRCRASAVAQTQRRQTFLYVRAGRPGGFSLSRHVETGWDT